MRKMKSIRFMSFIFLGVVLLTRTGVAAVSNLESDLVAESDATTVDVGWEPVEGVESYEETLLFNGKVLDAQAGVTGTMLTLENVTTPGYYTVFVRGVEATGKGVWSDPVTFSVKSTMTPGGSLVYCPAPKAFTWTRVPSASRYRLQLEKWIPDLIINDSKSGSYVVMQKAWILQPLSGAPKWYPTTNSISIGRWRWSITDYAGTTPGITSFAYFRVQSSPVDKYLVIDLSGGKNATRYPVTYLGSVPKGGWSDAYKTTKLVLRKIPAGSFIMGSPNNELGRSTYTSETQHPVTLTKAFYIGVFELTQRQWELVMGDRPSWYYNNAYYATRPVERVNYNGIREDPIYGDDSTVNWPVNSKVNASSFMGKLRAKTGLATIDLPTEAQWEYACRAGTLTALNSGKNLTNRTTDTNMAVVGRYAKNGGDLTLQGAATYKGTAKAGSYKPNAWGLYDMHGNVAEWCLDLYADYTTNAVINPKGAGSGYFHVLRGGGGFGYASECRSASRDSAISATAGDNSGLRVARTLP